MHAKIRNRVPIQERPWVVVLFIVCGVISAVSSLTGPIPREWLRLLPEKGSKVIQMGSSVLHQYGSYISIALAVILCLWKRAFLLQQSRRTWRLIARGYVSLWRFLLRPVLNQRQRATEIRYGVRVLFRHFTTGKYLTSLEGQNYSHPLTSHQQMVFGASVPDANSTWVIHVENGKSATDRVGDEIHVNDVVRIMHEATGLYLHSHDVQSPTSVDLYPQFKQREVTAYPGRNVQDNWVVASKLDFPSGVLWRFMHSDGNLFLHSHDMNVAVKGRSACFEVTCCSHRNEDDFWIVSNAD